MQRQPSEVIFKFDQPVGGTDGAVRVYDSEGDEVDDGDVEHPGGRQPWLGVGLEPNLPDGTYTATYRVISADTHIVYGGLVFNLGHASANGGVSVAGLIGEDESGEVTKLALRRRPLPRLPLDRADGRRPGLPGLRLASGLQRDRRDEPDAGTPRPTPSVAAPRRCSPSPSRSAIVVSLLGILLQGASAAGVSLWASLKWLDRRRHPRQPLRHRLAACGRSTGRRSALVLLAYLKAPRTRRWLVRPDRGRLPPTSPARPPSPATPASRARSR